MANPFDEARPVYEIIGEGVCELTVNGSAMSANVGQNLTIDTARQCAYRTDGTAQNTAVTGDYTKLYLRTGENAISVSTGFTLRIIPHWGWFA